MTAKLSLLHGRLVIGAAGADPKAVFRELGQLAEIFEPDPLCGECDSPEIRPGSQTVDGFDYYFLRCSSCGCELSLAQRRDGGLFPKPQTPPGRPCLTADGNATRRSSRPAASAPSWLKQR
jgi:hypothetical protein